MAMEGKPVFEGIPQELEGKEGEVGSTRSYEVELPRDERKERLMEMAPRYPEANETVKAMKESAPIKEAPKSELEEGIFLRDLEGDLSDYDKRVVAYSNELPPQQKIERGLDRKSQKAEEARGLVSKSSLGLGMFSAIGGMGLASAGIVEASVAVTGGMLGMAGLFGAGLAIPPLMYAGQKFMEWRRDKKYEKIYGKPPSHDHRGSKIWGLF